MDDRTPPSTSPPGSSTDWPDEAVPRHWVESLFERMATLYGNRFADLWRGLDLCRVQREWGLAMGKLGREHLRVGAAALTDLPYPPTLPQFLALCRPPFNLDAALYEAREQMRARVDGRDHWSDPAIFWAAVAVGQHDIVNQSHSVLLPRFAKALADVRAGGDIKPVPQARQSLPAPGQQRTSKEDALRYLAEIKAILARPRQGSIDWAYRLLERAKTDKTVTVTMIAMARAAIERNGHLTKPPGEGDAP